VARRLLEILERKIKQNRLKYANLRQPEMEGLVSAHVRLWDLRHGVRQANL
jgi:hypothetical protein